MKKVLLIVVVLAAGFVQCERIQSAADARLHAAQDWSGADAQFTTSGLFNSTLVIVLPHGDAVSCDAYVDSIRGDAKVAGELRAVGFTTLSCREVEGKL